MRISTACNGRCSLSCYSTIRAAPAPSRCGSSPARTRRPWPPSTAPGIASCAIFALFVGIAIFIACLGLFGLASFTAERRTREIGIRKVFGARARDIVLLLLWQFSVPVLAANLIAWPVAWYYLRHWLESYADRIALNPLYFLAAGIVALAIAWITVIAHTLLVARASPIRALRYE
jgi:putative ABC transport system permease protein